MTDILAPERIERADVDLVDDAAQFFAPMSSDVIDALVGQYQADRAKVERIAHVVTSDEYRGAVGYFLAGASEVVRSHGAISVERLFDLPSAVGALNSRYWGDALSMTDVYSAMPQARRDEWNKQLQHPLGVKKGDKYSKTWDVAPLPDFEDATVRNTLGDLLRQRSKFFAERVDGIFRGLSGEHVTNRPITGGPACGLNAGLGASGDLAGPRQDRQFCHHLYFPAAAGAADQ